MNINQSEQLSEFVKLALSKGLRQKDIEAMLLAKGWPKEIIDTLFLTSSSSSGLAISIRDLTKSFDGNLVLDSINLDIYSGDLIGVIGLSGSGKTTLLNLIVGFIEADHGFVYIHLPVSVQPELISQITKKTIGVSSQSPSYHLELTVNENLHHYAILYGVPEKTQSTVCNELMRDLDLYEFRNIRAKALSGGMQKRLDIACALIHNPKILILDEPTADIDPVARKQVWSLVKRINKMGTTVIVASHLLEELEKNCSRIAILHDHKIIKSGTPEQIRKFYSIDYEVHLETKSRRYGEIIKKLKQKRFSISNMSRAEKKLILYTKHPEETALALSRFIKKEHLVDLSIERPRLKTIFESIARHHKLK